MAANQHLIVQDLVSLGAQVNTTDCWGRTPLHVCAEKGHAQVLQVRMRQTWLCPIHSSNLILAVLEGYKNAALLLIFFLCSLFDIILDSTLTV